MAKILLIEDEAFLREDIEEMLTLEGFQVITAADGVEGVNSALRYQPDLIICDIMMPRLDGYEVLQDVRANSLTQFVPFIFLTARAARDDLRTGMGLGADDYLVKPFQRLDLLQAIQTRLDKKAALEEEHQEQLEQFQSVLTHERGRRLLTEKLVAMFSDEFRNPVASILTSATLLQDKTSSLDEKRRGAYVSRIEKLARYLLNLLDDMLLVGQLENGTLRYVPELLNVGLFFGDLVEVFLVIGGDSHPLHYENRFSRVVSVDGRLLRQIGANLIAHAIQSSPQGSPVYVALDHEGQDFILTVRDSAGNVSEAEQAQLRAAFQGGPEANDLPDDWLGLAIVRQAVEMHAGWIDTEYQPGEGNIVIVRIPYQ